MAGIYFHIPFCKTRCIYCDFYSTTNGELKERFAHALCKELEMRRDYLQGEPIGTIYFGGGTPSQLNLTDFKRIFDTIGHAFDIEDAYEITLEANPDDLTPEYVQMLATLPFNRISMGIQTFDDRILKLLKRRHTAEQAIAAFERCRQAGFKNISIDLMYGLPGETAEQWEQDLTQAISLNPEHVSAYHLIYEEGTPIHRMLQQHRVSEVDEESSVGFFSRLIERLTAAGYEHYEISNFCRPGLHSRHNSSYWIDIPYLGCGPSAHSYNHKEREWNVSSLDEYLHGIESGERIFDSEALDITKRYNERIITGLRTRWGISLPKLKEDFGKEWQEYCLEMASPSLKTGKLVIEDGSLRLAREGIFISDSIMSDLLKVDTENEQG